MHRTYTQHFAQWVLNCPSLPSSNRFWHYVVYLVLTSLTARYLHSESLQWERKARESARACVSMFIGRWLIVGACQIAFLCVCVYVHMCVHGCAFAHLCAICVRTCGKWLLMILGISNVWCSWETHTRWLDSSTYVIRLIHVCVQGVTVSMLATLIRVCRCRKEVCHVNVYIHVMSISTCECMRLHVWVCICM